MNIDQKLIIEALKKLGDLPDTGLANIYRSVNILNLKKNEFLFQEGDNYSKICLIKLGIVKKFYTTLEGKEFIKEFSASGDIVAPYSSLLQGHPASFSIQALGDVELLVIPYEKIKQYFQKEIKWTKIGMKIAELHFIKREKRELELLKLTAKERYKSFCLDHKSILKLLKKKDIAAYLGITPESLSRLERGIKHN